MTKSFTLLLLLACHSVLPQDPGYIRGLDARHFQLKTPADTIDFIIINGKLDTKKPVLIFCQGSNPVPLITTGPEGRKFITALNFDYKKIAKDYHLVLLSMPHTPVEIPGERLSKSYCFITDSNDQHSYHPSYLAGNYLDNYVRRTKAVIDFLSAQDWVSENKVILFGHSQGSKVAVGAAVDNPKVHKVGYASGNPLGRIDELVRIQRNLANEGKISQEEGQRQIDGVYDMWRQINEAPTATTTEFGDPNRTWTSFSASTVDDLLMLKQPLYVAYGTRDLTAAFCDLLPIYFTQAHKNNLTLKPYPGLEHNFFETDKTGSPVYSKGHWQEVMDEFVLWSRQ